MGDNQWLAQRFEDDAIEHMPARAGAFIGPYTTPRLVPSVTSLGWTAANEHCRRSVIDTSHDYSQAILRLRTGQPLI